MAQNKMEFIDLKAQQARIRTKIDANIARVLDHGQYILGPEIGELESKLARFVGVKHCVGVANGTDALLLSLLALGIKAGDEVITSPFSFIAAAEMIALLGAKPIFVDINPDTYNLDPKLLERAISTKTRAIVPVNLYGQCADYALIGDIALKYKVPVIEDAAQSFGAEFNGRKSCSFGTLACTSFFPAKPLGAYGDAGACFTNDDQLAERLRMLRNHGQDRRYHHPWIGINGRLDTLQAAILLAKLEIFPEELQAREKVAQRYSRLLEKVVKTPYIAKGHQSAWAQYTIEVDSREKFQNYLQAEGIPTAVHYPLSIHGQPVITELTGSRTQFPHSDRAADRVISLPMHPYLSESDQDFIITTIKKAVH